MAGSSLFFFKWQPSALVPDRRSTQNAFPDLKILCKLIIKMSSETEKLVSLIYDEIKSDLDLDGVFTPVTLVIILPKLMQLAGLRTELDGAHKKTLVIGVINRIIADTVKSDDKLTDALLQLTPVAIDTLYDVWVHRYMFKEMAQGCLDSCGSGCGGGSKPASETQLRKAHKQALRRK